MSSEIPIQEWDFSYIFANNLIMSDCTRENYRVSLYISLELGNKRNTEYILYPYLSVRFRCFLWSVSIMADIRIYQDLTYHAFDWQDSLK